MKQGSFQSTYLTKVSAISIWGFYLDIFCTEFVVSSVAVTCLVTNFHHLNKVLQIWATVISCLTYFFLHIVIHVGVPDHGECVAPWWRTVRINHSGTMSLCLKHKVTKSSPLWTVVQTKLVPGENKDRTVRCELPVKWKLVQYEGDFLNLTYEICPDIYDEGLNIGNEVKLITDQTKVVRGKKGIIVQFKF